MGGLVPVCLVGAEAACLTGPGEGWHTDPQAGAQQRRGLFVPHSLSQTGLKAQRWLGRMALALLRACFFLCQMGVMTTPPLEGAVRFQA